MKEGSPDNVVGLAGYQSRGNLSSKKGYMYTIAMIFMIVPIVLLVLFYTSSERYELEDTAAIVRCDELYYFVQDIEHDIERAMQIFGRRAAIFAIDDIVSSGRVLENYTFVPCSNYTHETIGAEAALAELMFCGTLYGQNVTYMYNHTLSRWLDRIDLNAEELHYSVAIDVTDLRVVPYDAWNFATIVYWDLEIVDESGLCNYLGENNTLASITNIVGLEDPLYPLHTSNRMTKHFDDCGPDIDLDTLAGCSTEDWGNGTGFGNVIFYSNVKDDPGLADFCSDTENINEVLLVFDMAFGGCLGLEENCFHIEHPDHMAGVIDYAKNDPQSFVDKCNITIPWISATGKLDNETGHGAGAPDPDCDDGNIYTGACIMIRNIPECSINQVSISRNTADLNTSCYAISNISQYHSSCDEDERYPNGPSFFDRLDGRLNLSERYVNESREYFDNEYIGIETFVTPYELEDRGISPNMGATWIGYLYWLNKTACAGEGLCTGGGYPFYLDCPHAYYYDIKTTCSNSSGAAPISWINEPANQSYLECTTFLINGSADDCDGDVASVVVRVDGQYHDASWDGGKWSFNFTPTHTDIYRISSQAKDADGLIGDLSDAFVLFVSNCSLGDNNAPPKTRLDGPLNGSLGVPRYVELYWQRPSDASGIYRYQLQVTEAAADWASSDIDVFVWSSPYFSPAPLANNRDYKWRVSAQDGAGNWGNWSDSWYFKT